MNAPRGRACFAVAVFGSLLAPGILNAGIVPQEMSGILAEFDLDELSFGILAASIAFTAVLLGLTAIWAIPRWGTYKVCLLGYGIVAAGLFGVTIMPAGVLCVPFGVMIAWGMAYLHQGNGLVTRLHPTQPGAMTNLLHGMNGLGKAIGPTFALVGATWREPFVALAGVTATLGLVGLAGAPPPKAIAESDEPEEAPARAALGDSFFWLCAIQVLLIVAMELSIVMWLPLHLRVGAGLEKAAAQAQGVALGMAMLAAMCAVRFAAPLLLRFVRADILITLCVPGMAGVLWGTETGQWSGTSAYVAMILCGVALSTPWPTHFSICCEYFPRHRGLFSIVSGASTSLAYIGFMLIGGLVAKFFGTAWSLRMAPMLAVLVLALNVIIRITGRHRLADTGSVLPSSPANNP